MGEALMFRAGGEGAGSGKWQLVTQVYTNNTEFVAPIDAKDNKVSVRLFGGGGGGCRVVSNTSYMIYSTGGGGGWMNNADITIVPGEVIPITIGAGSNGGNRGSAGGVTSFGTYLSANGADAVNESMGYGWGSVGGSGGSGGGAFLCYNAVPTVHGGNGYQFGGGAAAITNFSPGGMLSKTHISAGNGGQLGGGGGGGYNGSGLGGSGLGNGGCIKQDISSSYWFNYSAAPAGTNGVNTIANMDIEEDLRGNGIGGTNHGGGGGYGGNGGINHGGGGGYGARGGSFCGGGGGYGKNGYGGNGNLWSLVITDIGGRFRSHYNQSFAGGGGSYGCGASWNAAAGYGGGGAGTSNTLNKGGNGICIVQYYAKVQ